MRFWYTMGTKHPSVLLYKSTYLKKDLGTRPRYLDVKYDYGPVNSSWAPCSASCIHSKTVSVTDPAGKITRYTFGIRYNVSDGRLEEVNEDNLRITATSYQPFGAGPYPDNVGDDDGITSAGDGGINLRLAPVNKRVVTQQGATFTWEASFFDEFARPTKVNRKEAADSVTMSHELGGHAGGAGDQYKDGVGVNGQTLSADVPGPPNVMKDLSGAPANQQTLREIISAGTNVNRCAAGVSADNGGC